MISLLNILIFTLITWYAIDTSNTEFQIAAAYVSTLITTIQFLVILLYHLYTFTFIGAKIRETTLYVKFKSLAFHIKESVKKKERISATKYDLEADTRNINLFDFVTQDDSRIKYKKRVSHQQPTVSTVELTSCEDDQPYSVQRIDTLYEPMLK